MKNLIIDIDDVIVSFAQSVSIMLSKESGIKIPYHTHNEYDYYKKYGVSKERFFELLCENDFLTTIPFEPGAIRAVNYLAKQGFSINFATSRGYHKDAERITSERLESNGVLFDRLLIVKPGERKSEHYKKIASKFLFMIDDLAENLSDAKSSGVVENVILIDKPWNKTNNEYSTNINRFKGIESFACLKLGMTPEITYDL